MFIVTDRKDVAYYSLVAIFKFTLHDRATCENRTAACCNLDVPYTYHVLPTLSIACPEFWRLRAKSRSMVNTSISVEHDAYELNLQNRLSVFLCLSDTAVVARTRAADSATIAKHGRKQA